MINPSGRRQREQHTTAILRHKTYGGNHVSRMYEVAKVIELVERTLVFRFPEFDREAMRMKFKLHDIRESKVWQEAHHLGKEEGKVENTKDTIGKLLSKGMTEAQIADLLEIKVDEIHRLANGHTK
jgi:predicted transposase YdaD